LEKHLNDGMIWFFEEKTVLQTANNFLNIRKHFAKKLSKKNLTKKFNKIHYMAKKNS